MMYGDEWTTYKMHSVLHLPDDVEWHQCSIEALSAYPFENMQRLFPNVSMGDVRVN